jgi:hypothetical protein
LGISFAIILICGYFNFSVGIPTVSLFQNSQADFREGFSPSVLISGSNPRWWAFMGIPATGKQIVIRGIQINRFGHGKIAETWDFTDYMGLMTQLGVSPGTSPKK